MDTTTALEKIQMIKNERQARIAANERAKVEAEAAARAKARTEAEELLRAATESLPEFLRPFVVCDIPDDWTPQYRALSVRIEIPEHSTIRANYSYTGGREPLCAFEIAPKHIVDPEIETALEWHVAYYVTQTNGEAEKYVDGQIHINGIENFWSLLKRCFKGTYVSCEPFHLFRYLDEETFRFNNRTSNDAGRFNQAVAGIAGKRLTYDQLTNDVKVKQARLFK